MKTRYAVRGKRSIAPRWSYRDVFERYAKRVQAHGRSGISSAHDARHVITTGRYAERIAKFLGASPETAAETAIGGFTHDRIRAPTEELLSRKRSIQILVDEFPVGYSRKKIEALVDEAFARKARRKGPISDYEPKNSRRGLSSDELTAVFLEDKFVKRLGKASAKRIIKAIELGGKFPEPSKYTRNLVHTSIAYADKFFEANGAFIAFRRSYFMGEREDRRAELAAMRKKGVSVREAARRIVLNETEKRIKAYSNLATIPKRFHPFVRYQASWQYRLREGLERKQKWALNLAEVLFKEGLKKNPRSLEETISAYRPVGRVDREFKRETLRYLDGELWDTFLELVK